MLQRSTPTCHLYSNHAPHEALLWSQPAHALLAHLSPGSPGIIPADTGENISIGKCSSPPLRQALQDTVDQEGDLCYL